jgi:DNA-binding response OmpR family regulator
MEVVLCTASADRDLVARAASLRVAGYIVKPFQPKLVLAQVRAILDRVAIQKRQSLASLRTHIGLEDGACVEMMNDLYGEIRTTLATARTFLGQGKLHAAKLRLQSLESLCSILPGQQLRDLVRSVCAALEAGNLDHAVEGLETLEKESEYVRSLANDLGQR